MIPEDQSKSILSSILKLAANQAAALLVEEFKLQWNVKKEITNLRDKLILIQAFLDDAERKQHKRNVEVKRNVDVWVGDLQDVAYDAEDVLDEVATEASRLKLEGTRKDWIGQVSDFFLSCFTCSIMSSCLFHRGIAIRIKEIREEFDKIEKRGLGLGIQQSMVSQSQPDDTGPEIETSSFPGELDVVGRTKEKEELVRLLLPSGSDDATVCLNFSAISIYGMPGLGKTTLAQVVYNHPEVTEHFERMIWAHVSHRFDEIRLLRDMIESAAGLRPHLRTLDELQKRLRGEVMDKKFLIVLDDVWDQQQRLWEVLLQPLNCGLRGSKVLMTTRNQSAAETRVPTTQIMLEAMSNDECWSIFQKLALAGASRSDRAWLEMIGREIAKKAKGVPLAAKALGGLAKSVGLNQHRWRNVLNTEILQLGEEDEQKINSVLSLSFQQLPARLKQCFAYCAVFPKGYVFNKTRLIQIWMALGFIIVRGTERMEDVGSDYFEALVSRSFFQSSQGGGFMMHDLMHDLAKSFSRDEYFSLKDSSSLHFPGKVRHLSLSTVSPELLGYLHRLPKLRSLIFLNPDESVSVHDLQKLFKMLRNLRVLDLSRIAKTSNSAHGFWSCIFPSHLCESCSNNFPDSICSLSHLRYLRIFAHNIVRLPESLSNLYNLQNLTLEHSWKLCTLPKGVTNLVNLRHLEVEGDDDKVYEIAGIGKLTSLQKLKKFSISRETGWGIGELKDLNELGGKLSISGLENVASGKEAREVKLHEKHYIDVLKLEWCGRSIDMIDSKLDEEILEGLKPPTDLKELIIMNYGGIRSPRWMLDRSLVSLETVRLVGCRKWEVLPPLGQLPFLRVLELSRMDGGQKSGNFQFYDDDDCTGNLFPSLRRLRIWSSLLMSQFPTLPTTLTEVSIDTLAITIELILSKSSNMTISPSRLKASDCTSTTIRWVWKELIPYHLWAVNDLTISYCRLMSSLPGDTFGDLVNLRKLTVISCPNLKQLPLLPPTLVELKLSEVGLSILPDISEYPTSGPESNTDISSSTAAASTSLSILEIYGCPYLESLDKGLLTKNLKALKKFIIHDCKKLESLSREGFKGLVSLVYLDISDCPKLRQLPPLPSVLKYFGLNEVGLQALPEFWAFDETSSSSSSLPSSLSGPSLSRLEISECHELTSLCQGLLGQDLRSLEEVFICSCSRLVSLPGFRGFSSLKLLTVAHCSSLGSLPWDALPVSLKTLEIDDCPLLMDQCQQERCAYWPNISSPQIRKLNGRWQRKKRSLRRAIKKVIEKKKEEARNSRNHILRKILQDIPGKMLLRATRTGGESGN